MTHDVTFATSVCQTNSPGIKFTLFQNGCYFSILLFDCKLALLDFTFEREAKRAKLQGNRILKWRLFWNGGYFSEECDNLKGILLKLKYPENLINSTITRFIESRNQPQVGDVQANGPVRIILPFKDQRSADVVRRQLSDLGKKINSNLRPVFTSKKIADDIKVVEAKPPLINQQCVVYKFKCDLCDAEYVGYTCRHLFQRIEEHKHSAIGKHLRDAHNQKNKDLQEQFTILKKCRGKFECLVYEMLFIQEKKPQLNTQSYSIKAKLFST